MSGLLNDCDALLQAAPVRVIPNGDVAAALAAAEAAQDSADAANAAITDMARDDLLSPAEKPSENLRWTTITGERAGIDAAAAALGITTERTAHTNAYNTLNSYITGLGTGFTTIPGTALSIVGATYRTNFKNYYDTKQALLNAIAAKSATVAQWSGVAGSGRPADNASSDLVLMTGGTVAVEGNRAIKSSGLTAWDSSAISRDGYAGGAYVSARAEGLSELMFGLNSDPNTDSNWQSLDFCIYLKANGALEAYESSVWGGSIGTYVAGDLLAVVYDGSAVRYYKNGAILKTTAIATPIAAPLYFDSSFAYIGAALSNIRFGPLTSNNWALVGGSGKPQDNATVGAPAGTLVAGVDAATVAAGAAAGGKLNVAFTVSAGSDVNSTLTNGGTRTVTTRTATISGGEAPYEYMWVDVSGNGEIRLVNATSATVTIQAGGFTETKTGVLNLAVKDKLGRVAYDSSNMTVNFSG